MRTRHHSARLAAPLVVVGLTADGRAQTSKRSPLAPSPTGWKQAAYIKASNPGEGNRFGYAVALSGDGDTLAVGEFDADRGRGTLYPFGRNGGTWSQQARLQPKLLSPQRCLPETPSA
jgi:hypothetical protein